MKGLWYFFGIVIAAGIFAGIAGLGSGHALGIAWEQFHRHRRRGHVSRDMLDTSSARDRDAIIDTPGIDRDRQSHRLQLVSASPAPLPDISGRRLHSVRFFAAAVELDFGAVLLPLGGDVAVSAGSRRTRYPDPGFRDAICSLIGARVDRVRAISGDRVEISYDNGCELTAGRTGAAVA